MTPPQWKHCLVSALALIGLTISEGRASAEKQLDASGVVSKTVHALGGETELSKIQSYVLHGTLRALGGFPGQYTLTAQAPNRIRTEWNIGYIRHIRAFDGTDGWESNKSERQLIGSELERARTRARFMPLLHYANRLTKATLKREELDGVPVYALTIMEEGWPVRFVIDQRTFLPLRYERTAVYEEGRKSIAFGYRDYRPVGTVRMPFVIEEWVPDLPIEVEVTSYDLNPVLNTNVFRNPLADHFTAPFSVTLSTIPKNVYKESLNQFSHNDWTRNWGIPYAPTERWIVDLVVDEKYGRHVDPVSLQAAFYSGNRLVKTTAYSKEALGQLIKFPVTRFAPQRQIYNLRFNVFEFSHLAIDRISFNFVGRIPGGKNVQKALDVPIRVYTPKNKLTFPVKGNFIVWTGHNLHELAHVYEWSQHFGYDIICLGPQANLAQVDHRPEKSEDYWAYGNCDILAPADGTVVYARDDVPDGATTNETPGATVTKKSLDFPNPIWAIGGNIIMLEHSGGEYSLLAHSRQGSLKVKTGDRVRRGQVISKMGASGSPGHPHVHYQLQTSPSLFDGDGLPSTFDNVYMLTWPEFTEPVETLQTGDLYWAK